MSMLMNRLAVVAAILWCTATLLQIGNSTSYAQSPASLKLPISSVTTITGAAFHIMNGHGGEEEESVAIRGSGAVGVYGASSSVKGTGVMGFGDGDFGMGMAGVGNAFGVGGASGGYAGVVGRFTKESENPAQPGLTFPNQGLLGTPNYGVIGVSTIENGKGVMGYFSEEPLELGHDVISHKGVNRGFLGTARHGVLGETNFQGTGGSAGVAGKAAAGESGVGVYGESNVGFAGFFRGKVTITDSLLVAEVNANELHAAKGLIGGAKLFKIDHPLEPANKFLSHVSVESNEFKNMYDGVATLDEQGRADVSLPDWFDALNRDFRYQLTPIGAHAPLYIAEEIENGRFTIAGGRPGLKVSWQVTGVRQDAYARAHPVMVEQTKTRAERGKYLHPTELGFSETLAINRRDNHRLSFEYDDTRRRAASVRLAHSTSTGVGK